MVSAYDASLESELMIPAQGENFFFIARQIASLIIGLKIAHISISLKKGETYPSFFYVRDKSSFLRVEKKPFFLTLIGKFPHFKLKSNLKNYSIHEFFK